MNAFPAKLATRWWHTDVVFITTSCVYFLSWVEDEKPVHLAQLAHSLIQKNDTLSREMHNLQCIKSLISFKASTTSGHLKQHITQKEVMCFNNKKS